MGFNSGFKGLKLQGLLSASGQKQT